MTVVLVIRPADDSSAVQVGAWGQAIRQKLPSGPMVSDLTGAQVTRAAVDQALAWHPDHVLWFGHGQDDALVSSGSAVVDDANVRDLGGGVVVAIACYSAVTLAGQAVAHPSVAAFLGFNDEFGFPANAPIPMAEAVITGLDRFVRSGSDIGSAHSDLVAELDAARIEYKTNGAAWGLTTSESRLAWLFAKSNRASLRLAGDSTATL